MAKIIKKRLNQCENMLIRISWKETTKIYCHSFLIFLYICVVNLLKLLKFYFDTRVKRKIMKQFWMLSVDGDNFFERRESVRKRNKKVSRSVSPLTLTSRLGTHKYVKINSLRMHYIESGESCNDVILLLHGFPDCFLGWRNQIVVLSQNFHVIALDLKGFNDSDKPSMRHHYKPDKICHELKEFLDILNVKSLSIIGHDIGALIGWSFAYYYPERVEKFISISTPHPNLFWTNTPTKENAWLSKYWFSMIQIPLMPEKELNHDHKFIREVYKHLDETSNEISHGGENFKSDNLLETYEYIFGRDADWSGPLNYFRDFQFYRISEDFTLRCPCLIVFGTENSNFNLESAIKSAEYCENPLIKIIDGAGYFAHQTNPKELNAILVKYLVSEKNNNDTQQSTDDESRKSLMTRMMNKMYSVGQQYSTSQKWINYSN